MTTDDVVASAEIHAQALPHGFFARLGPRFLEAYHRSFVESPHAVATVATLDGKVAGFLVGTLRTRAHWAAVLRSQGWRLVLHAVAGLLRHPSTLVSLVRHRLRRYLRALGRYVGLVRRGEPERRTRAASRRATAVVTHVAVLPSARGHGLGAGLVGGFVEAVRAEGVPEIRLVTLVGEAGAGEFYDRLGWERLGVRRGGDGQLVVEYRWEVGA